MAFTIPRLFGCLALAVLVGAGCAPGQRQTVQTVPTDAVAEQEGERIAEEAGRAQDGEVQPAEDPPEVAETDEPGQEQPADPARDPLTLDFDLYTRIDPPHAELAVVTPELPEEQLEKERERVEDEAPTFDFPIEVNDKVLFWLDYYSNRHRDSFEPGLIRSGRYVDMFRRIFEEEGLPQDMVYMAHVESAYKVNAYSRARAKGVWQFISSTARMYDMRVDYWVDERSDPETAARAATAYLKKAYAEFGDYYLALAAYNAGEGRVRRAVARSGSRDFWEISRSSRYLRRETRNYVPAIIAAILISREPEKYGFHFEPDAPIVYDSIEVEGAADLRVLAECAGSDFETMKKLNPALRRYQTPPGATTTVRVPVGAAEQTLTALAEVPRSERVLYARHKVQQGETLSGLAREYGVTVTAIQSTNNMGRRTMIRAGHELVIPTVASGAYGVPAGAGGAPGEPFSYRVRRGDTLSGIARSHDTTAASIATASGISTRKTLQIGERLTVVPGARFPSRTPRATSGETASAERVIHVVRRGDTLYGIGKRYGTTPTAIAAASGISTRKTLQLGDRLTVVPGARTASAARQVAEGGETVNLAASKIHTVRRGDTLWQIANRYSTTIDSICALNGISKRTTLYPGTKLTVRN